MTFILRLKILCVLMVLMGWTGALAQPRCVIEPELIFKLRPGEYGSYTVWDSVYGRDEAEEIFGGGLLKPDKEHIVAVGLRRVKDGGQEKKLVFVAFNKRGRIAWEKEHALRGISDIFKILPANDGYAVFTDITENDKSVLFIGFFDESGKAVGQKTISDSQGHLSGKDAIQTEDGRYILAASYKGDTPGTRPHARIYYLSPKGEILTKRAYINGTENAVLALQSMQEGGAIGAGYIFENSGRKAGWAIRFDGRGTPLWQQSYPRGRGASLNAAAALMPGYTALAGEASPAAQKAAQAGWVISVNNTNGSPLWQRYLTGRESYETAGFTEGAGATLSLALNVTSSEGKEDAHVRLLTFDRQGQLLASDEYFNGLGAQATQLVEGEDGQRVLIGQSMIKNSQKNKTPEENTEPVHKNLQGWVAVATAPRPPRNPCLILPEK